MAVIASVPFTPMLVIIISVMEKRLDLLAVGDITTDAFIRLKEASVHCNLDRSRCELCMRFADKIPYESVTEVPAVGNSPNAAVAAARLGLTAGLVSNLGGDENGKRCLARLDEEKIDRKFVTIHKDVPANYHYVLWYEDERTILVKHERYERLFRGQSDSTGFRI
jgi:sugar/nucleoside kinase (ribokinase family)